MAALDGICCEFQCAERSVGSVLPLSGIRRMRSLDTGFKPLLLYCVLSLDSISCDFWWDVERRICRPTRGSNLVERCS